MRPSKLPVPWRNMAKYWDVTGEPGSATVRSKDAYAFRPGPRVNPPAKGALTSCVAVEDVVAWTIEIAPPLTVTGPLAPLWATHCPPTGGFWPTMAVPSG